MPVNALIFRVLNKISFMFTLINPIRVGGELHSQPVLKPIGSKLSADTF